MIRVQLPKRPPPRLEMKDLPREATPAARHSYSYIRHGRRTTGSARSMAPSSPPAMCISVSESVSESVGAAPGQASVCAARCSAVPAAVSAAVSAASISTSTMRASRASFSSAHQRLTCRAEGREPSASAQSRSDVPQLDQPGPALLRRRSLAGRYAVRTGEESCCGPAVRSDGFRAAINRARLVWAGADHRRHPDGVRIAAAPSRGARAAVDGLETQAVGVCAARLAGTEARGVVEEDGHGVAERRLLDAAHVPERVLHDGAVAAARPSARALCAASAGPHLRRRRLRVGRRARTLRLERADSALLRRPGVRSNRSQGSRAVPG